MSDAERYRQRAEHAERLADEAISPDHRDQLLKIAGDWRKMADRAQAQEAPRTLPISDQGAQSKAP